MATKKKVQEKKLADKSYRLLDDRSGEAFLLKTGKNKRLLYKKRWKIKNRQYLYAQ